MIKVVRRGIDVTVTLTEDGGQKNTAAIFCKDVRTADKLAKMVRNAAESGCGFAKCRAILEGEEFTYIKPSKTHGGEREGAGRPSTGRKQRKYYLTDEEHALVSEFAEKVKGETKMTKYRGMVIDELKTMETRKTKWYNIYDDAHKAAEKLCKRTMGERGTLDVECD
jgi:hypothetical protein